ncbi:MAG: Dyp-type peroxidase, partial [Hyphomicrobiales bacterium]
MRFPSPVSTRRRFLGGLGAAALLGPARAEDATPTPATEGTLVAQPFYGLHQAGIVTPQPAAALYVAFDVLAERRGELPHLFRTLTERLAFLTRGGAVPDLHPQLPPRNSGILGPTVL